MERKVEIDDLIEKVSEMEYGKTISIAEDNERGEGWWSITKIDIADSKALYCNVYGGSEPYVYPLDVDNDDIEIACKNFVSEVLNIDLNETLHVDYEEEKDVSKDKIERLENGNINCKGVVLDSMTVHDLVEFCDKENHTQDVIYALENHEDYADFNPEKNKALVEKITRAYEKNLDNDDGWTYSVNDAIEAHSSELNKAIDKSRKSYVRD